MNYQEYSLAFHTAAQLVETGRPEKAISAFEALLANNIPDVDKSIICLNIAVIYEKMGRIESVLSWYDQGKRYEKRQCRFYVAESKAAYLAKIGRQRESLREYQDLLRRDELSMADIARIETNIAIIEKQV